MASPEQAQDVHKNLRAWLGKKISPAVADATRIIYGGSVSEKNCEDLGMPHFKISSRPTFFATKNIATQPN